jgi:hypothetical protein
LRLARAAHIYGHNHSAGINELLYRSARPGILILAFLMDIQHSSSRQVLFRYENDRWKEHAALRRHHYLLYLQAVPSDSPPVLDRGLGQF